MFDLMPKRLTVLAISLSIASDTTFVSILMRFQSNHRIISALRLSVYIMKLHVYANYLSVPRFASRILRPARHKLTHVADSQSSFNSSLYNSELMGEKVYMSLKSYLLRLEQLPILYIHLTLARRLIFTSLMSRNTTAAPMCLFFILA